MPAHMPRPAAMGFGAAPPAALLRPLRSGGAGAGWSRPPGPPVPLAPAFGVPFEESGPVALWPQPMKVPILGASYSDLSTATGSPAASAWEDGYDDVAEAGSLASSPGQADGGLSVTSSGDEPSRGYSTREKTKLENLIRLHVHCLSGGCAPSAESVPAPPGLVQPLQLLQGPALQAPLVPPPLEPSGKGPWPAPASGQGVSFGSIGHPGCCAGPCKYVSARSRGCKDGPACDRCHLCVWPRRDNQHQQRADGGPAPRLRAGGSARSCAARPTPSERVCTSLAPESKATPRTPEEVCPPPPQPAAARAPALAGVATGGGGGGAEWTNEARAQQIFGFFEITHTAALGRASTSARLAAVRTVRPAAGATRASGARRRELAASSRSPPGTRWQKWGVRRHLSDEPQGSFVLNDRI
ncbi:unnamed protein product [Prorocentrum cordatum]|uniref:Uncharacterized protein n=1 Tax=Prorocentrum cordatum TaxID=2364126 RepID=A0ABN9QV92_9DINO|nr:unnamed protein product [Polarella glacialis]